LKRRFEINEEAIREMKRKDIYLVERSLTTPLWIRCQPLHIERVLDNLLNNASNAIPEEGGELSIGSFCREGWAIAEITNTGRIGEEDRDLYLLGDGKGRGIHITTRLVKRMGGKMEIDSGENRTTFRIMFPLAND
jgi:signal transduction histidine kinase